MIAFNEFSQRILLSGRPPYEQGEGEWKKRDLRDTDITWAAQWLQQAGIAVGPDATQAAMQAVAGRNGFHPVREYLGALKWDGTSRLDTWLIDHVGAADTNLTRLWSAPLAVDRIKLLF